MTELSDHTKKMLDDTLIRYREEEKRINDRVAGFCKKYHLIPSPVAAGFSDVVWKAFCERYNLVRSRVLAGHCDVWETAFLKNFHLIQFTKPDKRVQLSQTIQPQPEYIFSQEEISKITRKSVSAISRILKAMESEPWKERLEASRQMRYTNRSAFLYTTDIFPLILDFNIRRYIENRICKPPRGNPLSGEEQTLVREYWNEILKSDNG